MPKPPPQWNKRLGALCSTCHHPEAYHNRKLNYPTVPWQFIDGECCCGVGPIANMREVKINPRKLTKLAQHIRWRFTSGYTSPKAYSSQEGNKRIMTLKDSQLRADAIAAEMFRPRFISAHYGVVVSKVLKGKRYVCGCRKFTI